MSVLRQRVMPDTQTLADAFSHLHSKYWRMTPGLQEALKGTQTGEIAAEDEEQPAFQPLFETLATDLAGKVLSPRQFVEEISDHVAILTPIIKNEGHVLAAELLPAAMQDVFTHMLRIWPDYREEVQRLWAARHGLRKFTPSHEARHN